MHGVVVKPNGEKVEITIGEDDNDPIFTITDLLPHLAVEQMEKKLKSGVDGESLTLCRRKQRRASKIKHIKYIKQKIWNKRNRLYKFRIRISSTIQST